LPVLFGFWRLGDTQGKLKLFYWSRGINVLFYGASGSLLTTDADKLSELNQRWIDAVSEYPGVYLVHRLENFSVLLRWGETTTAVVATPQQSITLMA
jgi:hypothetical protein